MFFGGHYLGLAARGRVCLCMCPVSSLQIVSGKFAEMRLLALLLASRNLLTSGSQTAAAAMTSNYSTRGGAMNVFDRSTKRKQRARAAMAKDAYVYDYLKDHAIQQFNIVANQTAANLRAEVAEVIVERVADVSRFFTQALDIGCGRGHFAKAASGDLIGSLHQCDMSQHVLRTACVVPGGVPTLSTVVDEEVGLPFKDNTFDLAVSSLSLHWVNNLPGCLKEVKRVLHPDAPFIGVMFAGDTLFELRSSLQQAELNCFSGFSPHVSPFVHVRDIGGLLGQAGFTLTTIDIDEVVVNFPSMKELLNDLKGMGESNCAWSRPLLLRREALAAATKLYQETYGSDDSIPATIQLLYFIGWKSHPSQSQPLDRGSATASFKDLAVVVQNNSSTT